jgi:hypothetical protein
MDRKRQTLPIPDIGLELDEMARDQHGRPLDERHAMLIRYYVDANERNGDTYREIQHIVLAVHPRQGEFTVGMAVRGLYQRLHGLPDGIQVANAVKFALH